MGAVVTESDLVAAILAACEGAEDADGALTSRELVRRTGHSIGWVWDQLRRLHEAGQLECVWVLRGRIDGSQSRVQAYRLRKREV